MRVAVTRCRRDGLATFHGRRSSQPSAGIWLARCATGETRVSGSALSRAAALEARTTARAICHRRPLMIAPVSQARARQEATIAIMLVVRTGIALARRHCDGHAAVSYSSAAVHTAIASAVTIEYLMVAAARFGSRTSTDRWRLRGNINHHTPQNKLIVCPGQEPKVIFSCRPAFPDDAVTCAEGASGRSDTQRSCADPRGAGRCVAGHLPYGRGLPTGPWQSWLLPEGRSIGRAHEPITTTPGRRYERPLHSDLSPPHRHASQSPHCNPPPRPAPLRQIGQTRHNR